MERDEENGLNYHGARYYAPWLGRWVSTDPFGIEGGMNLYLYCNSSPVTKIDLNGTSPEDRPPRGIFKRFWDWTVGKGPTILGVGKIWTTELDEVAENVNNAKTEITSKPKPTAQGGSPPKSPPDKRLVTAKDLHANRNLGNARAVQATTGKRLATVKDLHANRNLGNAKAVQIIAGGGGGGTGIAKVGRGIRAGATIAFVAAMPDPTDALFLTINYFAAYGEAREAIREEWAQKGFAYGLSAGLLGQSGKWTAKELAFVGTTANVATLILDAEGIAENSFNKALIAGFKFGRDLTSEQRDAFLQEGLNALAAKGYEFTYEDAFGVVKEEDAHHVVVNLGDALRPTINQAFEAIRQHEEFEHNKQVFLDANTVEGMTNGPVPSRSGGSDRMR